MKKEETKDRTAMKGGLGTQMFLITYDDLRKFGEECAQNGVEHYLVRSNASKAGTSERLLNTQQVADMMQVSVPKVLYWAKEGMISSVAIGRKKRFRFADVQALIDRIQNKEIKL